MSSVVKGQLCDTKSNSNLCNLTSQITPLRGIPHNQIHTPTTLNHTQPPLPVPQSPFKSPENLKIALREKYERTQKVRKFALNP